MKQGYKIILVPFLLLLNSCITQFMPQTTENKELLVVEGLITDQPGANTVKLSSSLPLGSINVAKPVKGCIVSISDDLGNITSLTESSDGNYVTNPAQFQGVTGRFYTLHIKASTFYKNLNYESYPMEMKAVPPIDSLYYEKITLAERDTFPSEEGCQVYLNTHDPTNRCKFYRWEYSETWEIHLPYTVQNSICWVSSNSDLINVKNTSVLAEDRINLYPISFISNLTDRLAVKYSILVNQYSLNEDEYTYWEKLKNISEQVGGLYDMIPSSIPSNVYCLNDPNEKVLGFFSVSANSSKRVFIHGRFAGVKTPYTNEACIADTAFGGTPVPSSAWVIINNFMPPYNVYTYTKGCADCTVRGTKTEPYFWNEDK